MTNALIVLMVGLNVCQSPDLPNPGRIEEDAIERRRALRSGEVLLKSTGWFRSPGAARTEFGWNATIVFEGKKRRSDKRRTDLPEFAGNDAAAPREILCYSDDVHIFFNGRPPEDDRSMMMNVFDLDHFNDSVRMRVVDPRILGMVPSASANTVQYELDRFVGTSDYKSIRIEPASWEGLDAWKITKVLPKDVTFRSWIVPDRDFAVVRVESEYEDAGKSHVHSTASRLGYRESIRSWYPSHCDHRVTIDGEEVEYESLEIQVKQFSDPIDPEVFTLVGMDIPPGTGVQRVPTTLAGYLSWNGSEIVSSYSPPAPPPATGVGGNPTLLVVSSLAAATAVACCWWLFFRKAPPRTPTRA